MVSQFTVDLYAVFELGGFRILYHFLALSCSKNCVFNGAVLR